MERHSFLLKKLHQLSGIVPIGAFLVVHFWANDFAAGGAKAYASPVAILEGIPFLTAIEWIFIFLPILYHMIYGVAIALMARNNVIRYPYVRNWRFYLMRITGIYLVFFLIFHVITLHYGLDPYTLRFHPKDLSFGAIAYALSGTWVFWFTFLGVLAATYHLANGLWEFLIDWGLTVGPRAQAWGSAAAVGVFGVMTAMGLVALFAFHHQVGSPGATGLAGPNRVASLTSPGARRTGRGLTVPAPRGASTGDSNLGR